MRIAQADAANTPAQDALFEQASPQRSLSCLNVIENVRAVEDDVDAAVPEDAKNAPTRDLNTAKTAVFHSVHIDHFFLAEERRTEERMT